MLCVWNRIPGSSETKPKQAFWIRSTVLYLGRDSFGFRERGQKERCENRTNLRYPPAQALQAVAIGPPWGNSELGQLPYIDRGILNLISKGHWVEILDSTRQRGVSSSEICVASKMIQWE